MRTVTMHSTLSWRRLSALRLDLEDRQSELILELFSLSHRLLAPLKDVRAVPEAWRLALEEGRPADLPDADLALLRNLDDWLEELYRVNRALSRIDAPDFGVCTGCGREIPFTALASDPTRTQCAGCASSTVDGSLPAG